MPIGVTIAEVAGAFYIVALGIRMLVDSPRRHHHQWSNWALIPPKNRLMERECVECKWKERRRL